MTVLLFVDTLRSWSGWRSWRRKRSSCSRGKTYRVWSDWLDEVMDYYYLTDVMNWLMFAQIKVYIFCEMNVILWMCSVSQCAVVIIPHLFIHSVEFCQIFQVQGSVFVPLKVIFNWWIVKVSSCCNLTHSHRDILTVVSSESSRTWARSCRRMRWWVLSDQCELSGLIDECLWPTIFQSFDTKKNKTDVLVCLGAMEAKKGHNNCSCRNH